MKPAITIGIVALPDFDDWRTGLLHLGRIIRNEKGEVSGIKEYKDANEAERKITEINPAIYAFDKDWLWENISKLKKENAQGEYYLTDLIRIAQVEGHKIEAVPVSNILEGLQPNCKAELETLERLLKRQRFIVNSHLK